MTKTLKPVWVLKPNKEDTNQTDIFDNNRNVGRIREVSYNHGTHFQWEASLYKDFGFDSYEMLLTTGNTMKEVVKKLRIDYKIVWSK